jgi:quinol monooxygenase YgiN
MYARSTTFRGDLNAIDALIVYTRDQALPAVRQMDGNLGLSLLVDRHTGRCILTTSWDDATSMHRSAEAIRPLREAALRTVHAMPSDTEIAEWQVGVLNRVRPTPEHAACRVVRTKGPIGQEERIIEGFLTLIVPRIEDLAGVCSVSLLIDRHTGRGAIVAVYEDRQAMTRSKGQAEAMRQEFAEHLYMHVTDVAEFDVALAHLRVPETL